MKLDELREQLRAGETFCALCKQGMSDVFDVRFDGEDMTTCRGCYDTLIANFKIPMGRCDVCSIVVPQNRLFRLSARMQHVCAGCVKNIAGHP